MAQIPPSTTSPPALLRTQCPEATDISYTRLTCTINGHNKYWEGWVCRAHQGTIDYRIYSRWGKIGSRSPGYRVGSLFSEVHASSTVQDKIREKLGKGYTIVETGTKIGSINAFLIGTATGGGDPTETEADAEADRNYGRFRGL